VACRAGKRSVLGFGEIPGVFRFGVAHRAVGGGYGPRFRSFA
jgi:hypothetical protein